MSTILSSWEADVIQDVLDAKVKISSLEKEISELRNRISMTGGNARKPLEDELAQKQTELVWAKKDLKNREDAAQNLSAKTKNRYANIKKMAESQQKEADELKTSVKDLEDQVVSLELLYSKSNNIKKLLELEQKRDELKKLRQKFENISKEGNFLDIKESIVSNSIFMELNASAGFNTYFKVLSNLSSILSKSVKSLQEDLITFPHFMKITFAVGVDSMVSTWKIMMESSLSYFKQTMVDAFKSFKEALDPILKPMKFTIGAVYGSLKVLDKLQSFISKRSFFSASTEGKEGQSIKNTLWNNLFNVMANSLYEINEWTKGLYDDAINRTKRENLNRKDAVVQKPSIGALGIAGLFSGVIGALMASWGFILAKVQILSKLIEFGLIEPIKSISSFIKIWKSEGLGTALTKGMLGFSDTVKNFGRFFSMENPILKHFDSIGTKVEGFFSSIGAKFGKLIEFIGGIGKGSKIISGLMKMVGEFIKPVISIFKMVGTFAKVFIKVLGPIGWIIGIISSIYDFYKGFSSKQGSFLEKLIAGFDSVIAGLIEPIDTLLEWVGLKSKNSESTWQRIKNGFSSLFSFDWAKKLLNFLPDKVLDLIGIKDWVQSKNIVQEKSVKAPTNKEILSPIEGAKQNYINAKQEKEKKTMEHNENTNKKLDKLTGAVSDTNTNSTNAIVSAINSQSNSTSKSNEDEVPSRIPTEIIGAAFASLV